MKIIICLVTMTLFIRAFPRVSGDFPGTYQAIQCGSKNRDISLNTFIFDKNNGYLYYFDQATDSFEAINKRIEKERYFNSMEEFSSTLDKNKLLGNKLSITYIDYLGRKSSNQLTIKKIINLRFRIMFSSYENREGFIRRRIDNCTWVDPKKIIISY